MLFTSSFIFRIINLKSNIVKVKADDQNI